MSPKSKSDKVNAEVEVDERDIPSVFEPFFHERNAVIEGEAVEEYNDVCAQIVQYLVPKDVFEWLWAADLVILTWEILRYQRFKVSVLQNTRIKAVSKLLRYVNGIGQSDGDSAWKRGRNDEKAREWQIDSKKRVEVETLLASHGYDSIAISTVAFQLAGHALDQLDRHLSSAQNRRTALLKEFGKRREFAGRARHISNKIIQEDLAKPAQIAPPPRLAA